jgi:hypothetical protein
VNEVQVEKAEAPIQVQVPAEVQEQAQQPVAEKKPRTRGQKQTQVPKVEQPALTTDELVEKLPPAPTTDPRVANKRRKVEQATPRSVIPLGPMI